MILSLVIFSGFPTYADVKSDMRANLPIGQVLGNALGQNPTPTQIKSVVAEVIRDGGNVRQTVNTALGSGLDAKAVIAGAVAGGGDLTDIFEAALGAGYDSDFVSRAAKSAGASDDAIASAMATAEANIGGSPGAGFEAAEGGFNASDVAGIPAGGAGGGGGNVSNNQ